MFPSLHGLPAHEPKPVAGTVAPLPSSGLEMSPRPPWSPAYGLDLPLAQRRFVALQEGELAPSGDDAPEGYRSETDEELRQRFKREIDTKYPALPPTEKP